MELWKDPRYEACANFSSECVKLNRDCKNCDDYYNKKAYLMEEMRRYKY